MKDNHTNENHAFKATRHNRRMAIPKVVGTRPRQKPASLRPEALEAVPWLADCIDYGKDSAQVTKILNLDLFLKQPPAPGTTVRWINFAGRDPAAIQKLLEHFGVHALTIEDVLHIPQRPKIDIRDNCVIVIMRELTMSEQRLKTEQASLLLFANTVISFHETPGDVWESIRAKILQPGSKVRSQDASFLHYLLMDALIDNCYPVLETFGDELETLEEEIIRKPSPSQIERVHLTRRDLLIIRQALWPTREVIARMEREESSLIPGDLNPYYRDIYDHTVHLIDVLEIYREICSELGNIYLGALSNRMNEIMKVLTIIATMFIPITFLAGVYGMNFKHFPELEWRNGTVYFWSICIATAAGFLLWFRKKKWV